MTSFLASDRTNSPLRAGSRQIAYTVHGWPSDTQRVEALGLNGQWFEVSTLGFLPGNGRRCLSPLLMRFGSPDPFSPFGKGGLNAYGYGEGDPVNRHDPSGFNAANVFRTFTAREHVPRAVAKYMVHQERNNQPNPLREWIGDAKMSQLKAETLDWKPKKKPDEYLKQAHGALRGELSIAVQGEEIPGTGITSFHSPLFLKHVATVRADQPGRGDDIVPELLKQSTDRLRKGLDILEPFLKNIRTS